MILFRWIHKILGYIQNHFKAMLFLLLVFFLIDPFGESNLQQANLKTIKLRDKIANIDKVLEEIDKATQNPAIKGVLLNVDSPGGALAASIELSMAIKRLQQRKPVIAYASGSMTSGSYYASIWADEIIANPGAFIGSIGVLFQVPNIKPLADKLGIKEQVIAAGEYKQMGTFTRDWSKKEEKALRVLIDDAYELFISDVAAARSLKLEEAQSFADAKIFIAKKAKEVGLIDDVGSIFTAQAALELKSGVSQPVWDKPSELELFFEELKATAVMPRLINFAGSLY